MNLFIQCPHCGTRYRVENEKLRVRGYRARCGDCLEVFDARAARIDVRPSDPPCPTPILPSVPSAGMQHEGSAPAVPPPVVHPNPAPVLSQSFDQNATTLSDAFTNFHTQLQQSFLETPTFFDHKTIFGNPILSSESEKLTFSEAQKVKHTQYLSQLFKIGVGLLAFLSVSLGILFVIRNNVVGYLPQVFRPLTLLCQQLHCRVAWPENTNHLALDAVEMHIDPDQYNQFILIGVLKNRGGQVVAQPWIRVSLLDIHSRVLKTVELPPTKYLNPTEGSPIALYPGNEQDVRAIIKGKTNNATDVEGFRAELFYQKPSHSTGPT